MIMLIITTAAWGLSFPGGKALLSGALQILPDRDPWFFSSLMIASRFGLAAIFLGLAYPRACMQMRWSEFRQGLGLGLGAGLGLLLQADGLAFTEASTSAFLTQFTSVLVPLFVMIQTRRRPSNFVIFCVCLVLIGVAVLSHLDWRTLRLGRGELETLLGTGFFTAQILWLERPIFRGNHTGRVTLVMFLTIAILLLPVACFHAHRASDLLVFWSTGPLAILLCGLTVICSLFAFLTMNRWQPEVDATTAGILYCSEPLFATVFAIFLPALLSVWMGIDYLNEGATIALMVGGSLITVANILIAKRSAIEPSEPSEAN